MERRLLQGLWWIEPRSEDTDDLTRIRIDLTQVAAFSVDVPPESDVFVTVVFKGGMSQTYHFARATAEAFVTAIERHIDYVPGGQ